MSYALIADLINRAGPEEIRQIADRDRDGTPDAAVVDAALADADDVINGYVRTKYSLPLATVPPILRNWATSIARYVLHRNGAPEHVTADYRDAISQLKDVARGLVALPDAAGVAPAAASGGVLAEIPEAHFSQIGGWPC